ncbi:hypothetical protein ACJZ2D_013592 [Fusarium nematophilum]
MPTRSGQDFHQPRYPKGYENWFMDSSTRGKDTNDGDNQVSGTNPAPPTSPQREVFWPNLRRHALGLAPDAPPVKGSCSICYDDLSIAGLPAPKDGKQCLIAPCGHGTCPDCWPEPRVNEDGTSMPRECHTCRLPMECTECGRGYYKEPAPKATCEAEEVRAVPNSIPETDLIKYVPMCVECLGMQDYPHGLWFKPRAEDDQQ